MTISDEQLGKALQLLYNVWFNKWKRLTKEMTPQLWEECLNECLAIMDQFNHCEAGDGIAAVLGLELDARWRGGYPKTKGGK